MNKNVSYPKLKKEISASLRIFNDRYDTICDFYLSDDFDGNLLNINELDIVLLAIPRLVTSLDRLQKAIRKMNNLYAKPHAKKTLNLNLNP